MINLRNWPRLTKVDKPVLYYTFYTNKHVSLRLVGIWCRLLIKKPNH